MLAYWLVSHSARGEGSKLTHFYIEDGQTGENTRTDSSTNLLI